MTEPPIRDDLAELLRRRALTEDAARPDAVAKRHVQGGRTARENVADLVDEGSWVEYGRFAIAAQRARRELDDLIATTPADGLLAGTARIDGRPVAVLAYDYTVMAGTQGMTGHAKKDRLFELIDQLGGRSTRVALTVTWTVKAPQVRVDGGLPAVSAVNPPPSVTARLGRARRRPPYPAAVRRRSASHRSPVATSDRVRTAARGRARP